MPPPSIPLLCIPLHDSLSCVRSFGCHPCASQFPSSNLSPPPHSFQMTLFLLRLPSSPQPIVSLLPASLPPPRFFSRPPPSTTTRHSSFSFLNLTRPVCLRFECPTLISSPFPLAPCSLLLPSSSLFIYIEMDGGRAVRMD